MTPKRLAIQFAVVNLIHCRRVRRRNLSAKGCPPMVACLMLLFLFFIFRWKRVIIFSGVWLIRTFR
ncbi:MAG: hypothetical protein LBK82_13370 [Planctomycetaceae bacterium]|nr:hypothetical protein [Planctomycetaceae bacterium]